ncbi:MAG: AI-2E family transporter, partial [Clostridia bacterium]|nr:AI-2E family transporter [Clostridia bacterium]
IHPAAALFSSYVGLKLFGFFGIILGPAAAFMISEIINAGKSP